MPPLRSTHAVCSILACIVAAYLISVATLPDISDVTVDFASDPSKRIVGAPLPLSGVIVPESVQFTATITLTRSRFSSGHVRVECDDCLEAMRVNGRSVSEVESLDESLRCRWWIPLPIDLSSYLSHGPNTIEMDINNKKGRYKVDLAGIYPLSALLGMVGFIGLAIHIALLAILEFAPDAIRLRVGDLRLARITLMPFMGFVYLCAVRANTQDGEWVHDPGLHALGAAAISLVLLVRLLDRQSAKRLPLEFSACTATVSIGCFAYSAALIAANGWGSPEVVWCSYIGIVAGILTFISELPPAPRGPLGIVAVAAMCPSAYWMLNVKIWIHLASITVTLVRGLLWLCGIPTAVSFEKDANEHGMILNYYGNVSSPDFTIQIASQCGGLEGVLLFLFLLSALFLYDWPLFSKVKRLWAIYLVTIPFVLTANVVRITGILIYAKVQAGLNRTAVSAATVEMFHSNIGWVTYSVAFALFLPLVYRWARRSASVN